MTERCTRGASFFVMKKNEGRDNRMNYSVIRKIICAVCILLGIGFISTQEIYACDTETQTYMYTTVKETVIPTYTQSSYKVVLTGEDSNVTREDVVTVVKDIAEDYSSEYDIDMTGIKEYQGEDLEGYEVRLNVSNLSYKQQVKFNKKLKRLKKALKKKCKGRPKLEKVGVINKWCRTNIAVKSGASSDIYSVFTTRKATKMGLVNMKAFLIKECCGFRTRVVKYKSNYCTLVKIGKKSYIIED